MLFSSISFLYVFLVVVLLLYFLVPKGLRNGVLLLASLLFYYLGEPVYVLLLLLSSLSAYLHALFLERWRGEKRCKAALISSLAINLILLLFFKYTDFLIAGVNAVSGAELPLLHLPLPLGISFFTFQTMSYTIDVYRGDAHAERNFASLATFICLFPQLVAGPIVRYTDLADELRERPHGGVDNLAAGIRRFVCGLAKKVLLANFLGELCAHFRSSPDQSVLFVWLYAIAFTLQIYFDFSGYSDMAIGLGRLFGFTFPENFRYPYLSRSITEFWRCWHITLGSWFRDYVYIPLGGNRVGPLRWVINIAIVWMLTGLWHGAAWNFVLWGAFFGLLLLLEKWFLGDFLKKYRVFSHIYTLFLVTLSFVLFNGDGISGALGDLRALFGGAGLPLVSGETLYYLGSYALLLLLAVFGATTLPKRLYDRISQSRALVVLEPLALGALLLAVTAALVDGSFNPFLYFRF